MDKVDIRSLSDAGLTERLTAGGFPAYRAKQVRDWLNAGVTDFEAMTNLPKPLRERLAADYCIPAVTVARKWESALDDTVKYLFRLHDGETVESVLMHYKHGWSQCLSTQVGCRMGCSFCATGMGGLARNLLPSEMLGQIAAAEADRGVRVSSVVLMGMGEPLDNYDNVLAFLRQLSAEGGVQIGMRHISLSTCGLVDKIRRLTDERLPLTLSISLHAPNDAIRTRLMPVARRWSMDELLAACRDHAEKTGRRVSYEYALIDGVNDAPEHAAELASRLKGTLCHVNLIPANPVEGKAHRRSPRARVEAFGAVLERNGITATVRRTLGADIAASCGQLRRREQQQNAE